MPIHTMCYIHSMKCYPVIWNEVLTHAKTWVNLDHIVSQRDQEAKYKRWHGSIYLKCPYQNNLQGQ